MNELKEHAAGLDELHASLGDDGETFIWDSEQWFIIPGGAVFKRANDPGGAMLTCDLMLTCTVAQFGDTLPDAGQPAFFRGKEYTIQTVTTAPGAHQLEIHMDLNVKGM